MSKRWAQGVGATRWSLAAIVCGMVGGACAQSLTEASVWVTTGDQNKLLEAQSPVAFRDAATAPSRPITIRVDASQTFQTMDGFGAAVTESSAFLLQRELDPATRDALMADLFSTQGDGIGLNYVRMPMGASDFALTPYTYADVPDANQGLSNFSIQRDRIVVVPTLQQAKTLNPELRIMASPWSPPAWMKTNGSLNGGSLRPEFYGTYAEYFVKFAEAFAAEGLPINAFTPQNEPLNPTPNYPSMSMDTFEQSTFVGDHLGPALRDAGIDAEVLVFDHNWEDWTYPVIVANDPEAAEFVDGAAFHGYAGSVDQQSNFKGFHPDLSVHYTEITGGGFSNTDWATDLTYAVGTSIIGATRNWAETSIYWNIALDPDGDPHLDGGCPDCRGMVTIDPDTGGVTKEVEFYGYGHASKFVRPGATRIDSDSWAGVLETVAFVNPDGSEVLIALNPSRSVRVFDVVRGDALLTYTLPAQSAATFVWDAALAASLAGDFNGNGAVEQGDLDLVLGNWGGPRGDWANAEGLASGGVDQEELDAVLGNWGASNGPVGGAPVPGVPEPSMAAAVLGLLALSAGRRRSAARPVRNPALQHLGHVRG